MNSKVVVHNFIRDYLASIASGLANRYEHWEVVLEEDAVLKSICTLIVAREGKGRSVSPGVGREDWIHALNADVADRVVTNLLSKCPGPNVILQSYLESESTFAVPTNKG